MDKIILVGHPGSQFLVPASKYLVNKYLKDFEPHYINWTGDISGWSKFVGSYIANLKDEKVILTLDDYLVNGFHKQQYEDLKSFVKDDVVCAKLHDTNATEHADYPVTTQYTIWNREFLLDLLDLTTHPWNFEIHGSEIFKKFKVKSVFGNPAILYNTSSALSNRWKGVDWKGVKPIDLEQILNNKLWTPES